MDRADWIVTIAGAIAVWIAYAVIDHEPAPAAVCSTDSECADIDDHPAAGAPEPR